MAVQGNDIADAVNDAQEGIGKLTLSLLAASIYISVASAATRDVDLLIGKAVTLPLLSVEVPLKGFYIAAPLILVALHIYTLLHCYYLFRLVLSQRGRLDADLQGTLLPSILVRACLALEERPIVQATQRALFWIGTFLPGAVILQLMLQFVAYHSSWTALQAVLLLLDAVYIVCFFLYCNLQSLDEYGWLVAFMFLVSCIFFCALLPSWLAGKCGSEVRRWDICIINAPEASLVKQMPPAEKVNLENLPCNALLRYSEGLDLRRRDLRGADLTRACLPYADLRGADLSGARLIGADLRRTKVGPDTVFIKAELVAAHLDGMVGQRARSVRRGVSFREANLRRASIMGASLPEADFSNARLDKAWLNSSDLTKANFDLARLVGARVEGAILNGASFIGVEATDAWFTGSHFRDVDVSLARFDGSSFVGATLLPKQGVGAVLEHTDLWGVTGGGFRLMTMRFAEIGEVDFTKRRIERLDLRGAKVKGNYSWAAVKEALEGQWMRAKEKSFKTPSRFIFKSLTAASRKRVLVSKASEAGQGGAVDAEAAIRGLSLLYGAPPPESDWPDLGGSLVDLEWEVYGEMADLAVSLACAEERFAIAFLRLLAECHRRRPPGVLIDSLRAAVEEEGKLSGCRTWQQLGPTAQAVVVANGDARTAMRSPEICGPWYGR